MGMPVGTALVGIGLCGTVGWPLTSDQPEVLTGEQWPTGLAWHPDQLQWWHPGLAQWLALMPIGLGLHLARGHWLALMAIDCWVASGHWAALLVPWCLLYLGHWKCIKNGSEMQKTKPMPHNMPNAYISKM